MYLSSKCSYTYCVPCVLQNMETFLGVSGCIPTHCHYHTCYTFQWSIYHSSLCSVSNHTVNRIPNSSANTMHSVDVIFLGRNTTHHRCMVSSMLYAPCLQHNTSQLVWVCSSSLLTTQHITGGIEYALAPCLQHRRIISSRDRDTW